MNITKVPWRRLKPKVWATVDAQYSYEIAQIIVDVFAGETDITVAWKKTKTGDFHLAFADDHNLAFYKLMESNYGKSNQD